MEDDFALGRLQTHGSEYEVRAYGIPGKTIDGNDVEAVYAEVGKAVARARQGAGPSLVECKTYRHYGHFEGDPQTYKKKEESEEWMAKDPIPGSGTSSSRRAPLRMNGERDRPGYERRDLTKR